MAAPVYVLGGYQTDFARNWNKENKHIVAMLREAGAAEVHVRISSPPVIKAVRRWGQVARRLQPGSVHRYLAYGLGALVVTLVVVAVLG